MRLGSTSVLQIGASILFVAGLVVAPPSQTLAASGPACADIVDGGATEQPTLKVNLVLSRNSCASDIYRLELDLRSTDTPVVIDLPGTGTPVVTFDLASLDPTLDPEDVNCLHAETWVNDVRYDRAPNDGCTSLLLADGLAPNGDYDSNLPPCADIRLVTASYSPASSDDDTPVANAGVALWHQACKHSTFVVQIWRTKSSGKVVTIYKSPILSHRRLAWSIGHIVPGTGSGKICVTFISKLNGTTVDRLVRCATWQPDPIDSGGRGFNWY